MVSRPQRWGQRFPWDIVPPSILSMPTSSPCESPHIQSYLALPVIIWAYQVPGPREGLGLVKCGQIIGMPG